MGEAPALGVASFDTSRGMQSKLELATEVVRGTITAIGPGVPIMIRGPFNVFIKAVVNTTLTTTNASSTASVGSGSGMAVGMSIQSVNVPPGTTWATFSGTSGTLAFPIQCYSGTAYASGGVGYISNLPSTANLLGATVTVPYSAEGVTIPANTTVAAIITTAVAPTNDNPLGIPGLVQLSAAPTLIKSANETTPFYFALTNTSVTTGADTAAEFQGAGLTWVGTVQLERSYDGGKGWSCCNAGGAGTLAQYTGGPVSTAFGEPERGILYRVNCTAYTSGMIKYRISGNGAAATSLNYNQLS